MSTPSIGREPHFSMPDLSAVTTLPKPIKAVVYLMMLSVLTVASLGALLTTVVIIGQLSGAFDIVMFL
ncbi:hypothetical protein [Parasphingorhabdus pacifica]